MVKGKKTEPLTTYFPDEESIFEFLNLVYKSPTQRQNGQSVEIIKTNTKNTKEEEKSPIETTTIKDIDKPNPKPKEVVFKVKAAALNYDDIWGMRGKPLAIPLPHISGTDAAGEVIAIGDDVKNIKIGDRIVSHGNMSCRICKNCTTGREFDCKKRRIWGSISMGFKL